MGKWVGILLGAFGVALLVGIMVLMRTWGGSSDEGSAGVRAKIGKFQQAANPAPVPPVVFRDIQGREVRLSDFAGRVVLLDLWATWCSPCVREMPGLDRLQAELGGPDFLVLALSQDVNGAQAVMPFMDQHQIHTLVPYFDPPGVAARELHSPGLPTTVLIDRDGREVGRVLGGADWAGPQLRQVIQDLIAAPRAGAGPAVPVAAPAGHQP